MRQSPSAVVGILVVVVMVVGFLPVAVETSAGIVPRSSYPISPAGGPRPAIGALPAGSLPTYSITFTGTGLPNGSTWDATLNGTSDSLVGVIPATVAPRGFLYDGLNSRLYLATTNSSSVAVIDPTTNSVVGSIPVGADPRYLALDPTSDYVYVTNTMSNNVTVINGATDTVVGSIPVGANPIGIAFDAVNGYLYVADSEYYSNVSTPSNVTVINAATDHVVGSIPVGYDSRDLSYDPLNGLLYIANYDSGNLTIVNTTDDRTIGSIVLGIGFAPSAPTVDTANGELYFSINDDPGFEEVLSPANNTVVGSIMVGSYPAHPLYDPANGLIYVGNEFSNNVSVIDPSTNTVIGSIPAGSYPATLGLDSASGDLYVANWQSANVTVVNASAPNGGAGVLGPALLLQNTTSDGTGTAQVSVYNGWYEFTVGGVPGYAAYPGSGSVAIDSSGSTVAVTFVPQPYSQAMFSVTGGLPAGKSWTVRVGGQTLTSTTDSIVFRAPVGGYRYVVAGPAGSKVVGIPATGLVVLNGTGPTAKFTFAKGSTYRITFHESGLPRGALWCVLIGSLACSNRVTLVFSDLAPGTYAYAISPILGEVISATQGRSLIALTGSLGVSTRNVNVELKYVRPYVVTFREVGLTSGDWSVTIKGVTGTNASGDPIVFHLPNGTHAYKVGSVTGYASVGSPKSATVHGAAVNVTVTFTLKKGHSGSPSAESGFPLLFSAVPAAGLSRGPRRTQDDDS